MPKRILSIDIGGSHIKGSVLDDAGKLLQKYKRLVTPQPTNPESVLATIKKLSAGFRFDCVSIGFPGYVRDNIVYTAPNLEAKAWNKIKLAQLVSKAFANKPVRVINDADMLGLGVISGKGLEMMITLGTGFGTALYLNGKLLPHLEIAHHPIAKNKTYDEYIGEKALEKIGKKKWNNRLAFILEVLKTVFNYDTLYIGGGNARNINFKLGENIKTVTNLDGIDGGAKLWAQ